MVRKEWIGENQALKEKIMKLTEEHGGKTGGDNTGGGLTWAGC